MEFVQHLVEFVQHLDEVPLFLLASRNRLLAPLVVPLLREAQYPARHPTGTRSGAF